MAVGRILFGFWCVFAAILLLELALQLGAWYVSATGREPADSAPTRRP
jgi:hypothetical protein